MIDQRGRPASSPTTQRYATERSEKFKEERASKKKDADKNEPQTSTIFRNAPARNQDQSRGPGFARYNPTRVNLQEVNLKFDKILDLQKMLNEMAVVMDERRRLIDTENLSEQEEKMAGRDLIPGRDAIDEFREGGPQTLSSPELRDRSMSMFANAIASALGEGLSSAASPSGTVPTSPGGAALDEYGNMLMADVERYESEVRKTEMINNQIIREFQGNVAQMEMAYEERLDSAQRSYLSNKYSMLQNKLLRAQGYEDKASMYMEAAAKAGVSAEEIKNQEAQFNTNTENKERLINAQNKAAADKLNIATRNKIALAAIAKANAKTKRPFQKRMQKSIEMIMKKQIDLGGDATQDQVLINLNAALERTSDVNVVDRDVASAVATSSSTYLNNSGANYDDVDNLLTATLVIGDDLKNYRLTPEFFETIANADDISKVTKAGDRGVIGPETTKELEAFRINESYQGREYVPGSVYRGVLEATTNFILMREEEGIL